LFYRENLFFIIGLAFFYLGETPCCVWVKHRAYPQGSLGETPCLSTGQATLGKTPIAMGSLVETPIFLGKTPC
jgi:hypothetical protein